jgi:hypothetical protein
MSFSVVLSLLVFGVMFTTVAVWIGRTGGFRIRPSPVFAVLGIWCLYIVGDTVVGRLLIETDGTVVARQPVNNPRPGTFYTMQAADGQAYRFASGASDVSLSRDFAVGSHVTKRKWDLGYIVDGRRVDDFEVTFYSGWATLGVFLIFYGLLPYLGPTRPNQTMQRTAPRSAF